MTEFILNSILWTLAIYGLIEIIKVCIYTFTYKTIQSDEVCFIIAVKNGEQKIEGIIRTILFRLLYEKEEYVKDIIVADLGSTDETKKLLKKMQHDYGNIEIMDWEDCKKKVEEM